MTLLSHVRDDSPSIQFTLMTVDTVNTTLGVKEGPLCVQLTLMAVDTDHTVWRVNKCPSWYTSELALTTLSCTQLTLTTLCDMLASVHHVYSWHWWHWHNSECPSFVQLTLTTLCHMLASQLLSDWGIYTIMKRTERKCPPCMQLKLTTHCHVLASVYALNSCCLFFCCYFYFFIFERCVCFLFVCTFSSLSQMLWGWCSVNMNFCFVFCVLDKLTTHCVTLKLTLTILCKMFGSDHLGMQHINS